LYAALRPHRGRGLLLQLHHPAAAAGPRMKAPQPVARPQKRAGFFHAGRLGALSPAAACLIYGLLGFWTLIVLFPLYWLFVTSFKLPIDVAYPPNICPSSISSLRSAPGATSSSISATTPSGPISIPLSWRRSARCSRC